MKARFYCDSCGAEVRGRSAKCPSCGKTFAAVRCPRCGYEGPPADFVRGCRLCGYMSVNPEERKGSAAARPRRQLSISPLFARVAGGILAALLVALLVLMLRT